MGFLDHSTNNVIIDAVLTDRGRELLARNDGSFEITKFAFGDDEVDYSIIKKFGRTVGKEKIEKNTPIFEAQTAANQAQKYHCFTLSNPFITVIPGLVITTAIRSAGLTSTVPSSGVVLEQQLASGQQITTELRETFFYVDVNNKFLKIDNAGSAVVDSANIARYMIKRNSVTAATQGAKLAFTLRRKNLSNPSIYSAPGTTSTVKTVVTVTGKSTGIQTSFEVSIDYSVS